MTSTDLEVQRQAEIEAILAAQDQEEASGPITFQTPILKVCQALTKEVKAGDAEAGEFLNTLTGESYGTSVEFIPSFFQFGRAGSNKTGRYFVAIGTDVFPEHWKDLVGEEFVGTRFDEHPDAEEQYKHRVNTKQIEWGKGPLISTTYNYTGLVIPAAVEGEDEVVEPLPVRISFLRSTKGAHDKLQTLKKATRLRHKPWWDSAFQLSTESKSFGRNDSFIVNVKRLRDTTEDEKLSAVELAQAVMAGRTVDNAEAVADAPAAAPATPAGAVEI